MRLPLNCLPRVLLTALGLVLMTGMIAPPLIVLSLFTKGGPAYVLMRVWGRAVAKFMGLTFSIHGTEKVIPGTSYIITPNHQSNADILALVSTLPMRFRWVVKKELLKIPLFGWAVGSTGAISLDRSNREESVKTLQEGTSKLHGGWSVLIYPEGTRTSDGMIQNFKKGPFMMAVQTGIPILPVTCNGAFKVLPKKTLALRAGHISITIGNPIPTEGLTEKNVPELMEESRQAMLSDFNPDYDPFTGRNGK
ncbi:MAG TPA: lysophospholipid acyltransferase family protein [Desulfomonilaceae bacterium]|nr:lysophospholipid acyltransferase family protein [Desulfomonilaceae bacterium]